MNTVHSDYADLKQTIAKSVTELQQELVVKVDTNSHQLHAIAQENKMLISRSTADQQADQQHHDNWNTRGPI